MKKLLICCSIAILTLCLSVTAFAAYLGDVNDDGNVTAGDARIVLRYSAKLDTIEDGMISRADVDGNGKVTASDARLVLRMSAKLEELKSDCEHEYTATEIQKQDCEKDGIIEYRCSVCDHNYQDVTKATGHNYSSEVTKEASCGVKGIKTFTCSICNHSYTEDIEALQHEYVEVVVREPSCATGLKEYMCVICDDFYSEESPAIIDSHTFGTYKIIQEETCANPRIYEATCNKCGEKNQRIEEKRKPHNFNYTYEVIKEATYNDPGENKYTCINCGYVEISESDPLKVKYPAYIYLPETTIFVSEYNYSNKVKCNFRITDLRFDVYYKNSDGTYDVKIYYSGEKTYDISGNGNSASCKVGYKLYDKDGYVVDSGTDYTVAISVGEKVKDEYFTFIYLKPGEYRLEILDVR